MNKDLKEGRTLATGLPEVRKMFKAEGTAKTKAMRQEYVQ